MTNYQIFGVAMLGAALLAFYCAMGRSIGFRAASMILFGSIAGTAFVAVGSMLLSGQIK